MLKSSAPSAIRLRGVRHNNLKNFDLDLPLNELIVITGLSGSGKSSLAFDTLFAEGQRRYIETFSPYARQFLDRMDKPQVDSIEGIPPAIAIEQRNSVKTTRSTVGTMTELCDYMKMLWPHVSQLHCRNCGEPVHKEPPQRVFELCAKEGAQELLITFTVPLTEKLSLEECLALVAKQGYQRVLVSGQILRLEELAAQSGGKGQKGGRQHAAALTVVQDRVRLTAANRARFVEACEQAYHFGKGKLTIWRFSDGAGIGAPRFFSAGLHCAQCDIEYREPSPALFSFNHPVGACPTCRGFGRVISIDYDLALPDRTKTLAQGVVKPWQTGHGQESQMDLLRACRQLEIPVDVPFEKLPKKWQQFVIDGDPAYGTDEEHEWPRAWYGVKGYFRWLESKAYKMHVRVLLSRYRAYTPCPTCQGKRFQPDALLYRLRQDCAEQDVIGAAAELTLADFYALPVRDALGLIKNLKVSANKALKLVLGEVRSRLCYLEEVGLGYLTLDRPTRSLSGGETERVSLTTCLGTRLVNTLFVLDEPSVGLHPRDTQRLVGILKQLREAGNTVVVVEHEASVMRAADQLVDLGPGHGAAGGRVVFQGGYSDILKCKESLTGQYLSGEKQIELPPRRAVREGTGPRRLSARSNSAPKLYLANANRHNLKNLTVQIPLRRFVCVTGVSGSGKTTLVRELLLPALAARLRPEASAKKASERMDLESNSDDNQEQGGAAGMSLSGTEHLERVVLVDQSLLGKTPRSNPAVYIGAFDELRELFAQSEAARQRGLNASAFSFNSSQGQCERCRGAGFEKIEMQFLSDVFIRCPDCNGRRYRSHILEVKLTPAAGHHLKAGASRAEARSIADLLDSTVEEVLAFLGGFPESRPARRALESLKLLEEVGLGYLKIGQPINTLSGGESQRLKLVRHLAEALDSEGEEHNGSSQSKAETISQLREAMNQTSARYRNGGALRREGESFERPGQTEGSKSTLFLFDEPTTGLHFEDVRVLLKVFQRLVDGGHSVLVIEHNLEVLKSADWIIDLGPGAGDEGGRLVAEGTPEEVAACAGSYTGQALREVLPKKGAVGRKPDASLRTAKSEPRLPCPGI